MSEFNIGQFTIGEAYPPFVIAEVGVHHDNSVELAKAYIREARLAGVQAVKFQTYKAGKIAARWAPTYWDSGSDQTQYDIFAERDKLTPDDYKQLVDYALQIGIMFLSTPFDTGSASLLNDLGVPAFKIASADLTFIPLLEHVAHFKKPLLLSTGAATFEEIRATLDVLRPYDVPIVLLHCSLSYPTQIKDANLGRIRALQEAFPDVVVGYSDHTQPQDSELACPLSVSIGARVVEKHYTLNKYLEGDDHYHAVDQAGLIRLVKQCRDTFWMTRPFQEMTEAEQMARQYARRSIVAARPLSAGTVLQEADVDFKRPGTGVSPAELDRVLGKRLLRDLEADALILYEHLELSGKG